MADSTIEAISPTAPAWVERAQQSASRVARGIRPAWVVATAVVGVSALGLVAAQVGEADLQRARTAQVERVALLETELRAQQLSDARAAIQLDDLSAQTAEQLARLASAEGFLK